MHRALGDFVHGAGHQDRKVLPDLDADFAAGHVHGDAAVHEAEMWATAADALELLPEASV